jgi:hypothetical protein
MNIQGKQIRLSDAEAGRLFQFYSNAETDILREINRGLLRGNDLSYLQTVLQNVQAILNDLLAGSRTWCEEAIPRIYVSGAQSADQQLKQLGAKIIPGFGAIHQQAAQVLAENAYGRFQDVGQFIGRRVDDIYRNMALENVRGSVAGYKTWQQVATSYRNQLAEQGITGFVDKAGRQWNMRTYAETVARTTTMEAHLQGTANRLLENGHDLVKVSSHAGSCPKCLPWQGKIISLTGRTEGYPTLQEAKDAGLFHSNCRHAFSLSIDLDKEIEELERELGQGSVDNISAGEQAGSGGSPDEQAGLSAIPIAGISTTAKSGIAQAMSDVLAHGLKTNTECLLAVDAKTGKAVYNKVAGSGDVVQFPQQLIDTLDNASARSILLVHNHPGSSSFSDADVGVLVRFDSVNGLLISGHDGTKYYIGKLPNTGKVRESLLAAEYQKFRMKYYGYYKRQVDLGKMTATQAWKEHSHKIMEDLAQSLGLEYRRWGKS